jgi:hypothetical protein
MAKFAVLDNINVVNMIEADSLGIAKEVTGKECIEYTDENVAIGGSYENGVFLQPKPYPSWVLDSRNLWVAPVVYPDDLKPYTWDESTVNWVEVQEL